MSNASIMFLLLALSAGYLGFGTSLDGGAGAAQFLLLLATALFLGSMTWDRCRLD